MARKNSVRTSRGDGRMKVINIMFSKTVGFRDLTKEIELIHQLGFFVEVESLDDYKGIGNRSYEIRAVMWEHEEELEK